jgi:cytochrome c oxidase accessory protein FixG
MSAAEEPSYRDKLATIDTSGKRNWIYPKKPSGPLYRWRTLVSWLLMALFFVGPFIRVAGRPILLLGFLDRKIIIFGLGFYPQDFHLFVLLTISMIVFIVLFTVAFGRIWCGWACPQTIFMEMLFRKIEYLIEGDANKQRALNKAEMSPSKFFKKLTKHTIFYAISFFIGNTFLAYIIGSDRLLAIISEPPSQHIVGLSSMIIFSGVFYGVFAFMREQVCMMVCPYGRLQGVMLDKNSIVISYDFKRGEPRGKLSQRKENPDLGHCVDCRMCVAVCPTGIDIRNGTQLECVNCTACIDACNIMMEKTKQPPGLIRYASYNSIESGEKFKFSPRLIGYSTVLAFLVTLFITLMMTRAPIETTILRTPGIMFQETDDGKIANLYNIKVMNKTFDKKRLILQLKSPAGKLEMVGGNLTAAEGNLAEGAFFIRIPKEAVRQNKTIATIQIYANQKLVDEITTSFVGPIFRKNKQ